MGGFGQIYVRMCYYMEMFRFMIGVELEIKKIDAIINVEYGEFDNPVLGLVSENVM